MRTSNGLNSAWAPTRAAVALALAVLICLLGAGAAGGAGVSEELEQTEERLEQVEERQGILTSELERMTRQIVGLQARVGALRSQEARVEAALVAKQADLDAATAELASAEARLEEVRDRLQRALIVLRDRLVAIYQAGTPDILSTVVEADDWSDAVTAAEYLNRIHESDEAIVTRVSSLRDESREAVEELTAVRDRIAAARDAIVARRAQLAATRLDLIARQGELRSARSERERSLARLEARGEVLEGDVSALQAELAAQLGSLPMGDYPSGPVAPGSFIWPTEGVLTSTFGPRWGRMHEGIDIGAAEGTPIWAAADGTVVLQQGEAESGGYGNFVCVDHGGGIATCYAHMSAFNATPGQRVSQGDVIGLVGNTGNSFGAHLHFEVRIGGVAQDPLGYL